MGKLNYEPYANNEIFTVIFRGDITTLDEPVITINQWTKDAKGEEKANSFGSGTLDRVRQVRPGVKEIEFFKSEKDSTWYW